MDEFIITVSSFWMARAFLRFKFQCLSSILFCHSWFYWWYS